MKLLVFTVVFLHTLNECFSTTHTTVPRSALPEIDSFVVKIVAIRGQIGFGFDLNCTGYTRHNGDVSFMINNDSIVSRYEHEPFGRLSRHYSWGVYNRTGTTVFRCVVENRNGRAEYAIKYTPNLAPVDYAPREEIITFRSKAVTIDYKICPLLPTATPSPKNASIIEKLDNCSQAHEILQENAFPQYYHLKLRSTAYIDMTFDSTTTLSKYANLTRYNDKPRVHAITVNVEQYTYNLTVLFTCYADNQGHFTSWNSGQESFYGQQLSFLFTNQSSVLLANHTCTVKNDNNETDALIFSLFLNMTNLKSAKVSISRDGDKYVHLITEMKEKFHHRNDTFFLFPQRNETRSLRTYQPRRLHTREARPVDIFDTIMKWSDVINETVQLSTGKANDTTTGAKFVSYDHVEPQLEFKVLHVQPE